MLCDGRTQCAVASSAYLILLSASHLLLELLYFLQDPHRTAIGGYLATAIELQAPASFAGLSSNVDSRGLRRRQASGRSPLYDVRMSGRQRERTNSTSCHGLLLAC